MTKKFYKYAAWTVLGVAAVSVFFSLMYFLCEEFTDPGNTLLVILYYLKLICDVLAAFVGYGTIIYAVTKFGWQKGVAAGGIFFCSVLLFFLFQTVTLTVSSSNTSFSDSLGSSENIVDLITFNAFYSLGQLIITFMIPAAIAVFLSYKLIKKDDSKFEKYISFKNPVQKTMGLFCIIMTAINFLSFLFIDVLYFLIEEEFYIYRSDFWTLITQSALSLFETVLIYIVVQYIVFMLVFRLYDYCLYESKGTVDNKTK